MSKRFFIIFILSTLWLFAATDKNDTKNDLKKNQKEYNLFIKGLKHLDKEDLAKALGVKDDSFFLFGHSNKLKEEFVKNLEPSLKGYLENKGYFDAKYKISKNDQNITIDINEGKPIRVSEINIKSNFKIKKLIKFKKGDIFEASKFSDIKDKLITKLLENGYCHYKLNTKAYIDLKKHTAKLNYRVNKGKVCRFGKITIIKHPKDIKKDVIYSRLKYKSGNRFDIRAIQNSYNSLNTLNTFANLQIKYDLDESNNTVETTISVDKREKLKRYMLAIGADSIIGPRIKGSWEKRDFLGNAKKITINAQFSKEIQGVNGELFAPAFMPFLKNYLDLYISGGYEIEDIDAYNQKKYFFDSHLSYDYRRWSAKLGIGIENLQINLNENLSYVIGGTFNLIYPYYQIIYDSRDSKLDPKNGIYISWYNEYGLASRQGGVQYLKYLLEARAIKSFGNFTFSAVGKIGAIHEVSGRLPASKLFYGGGLFSNRAYAKNDLGIILSNKSFRRLGGKSYVNLQLETNFPLYKKLYGALFFDSTIINAQEYKFTGKRIDTLGFGFRYKTPIGPVKIDIGFNMHKRSDHSISIMLGQSF